MGLFSRFKQWFFKRSIEEAARYDAYQLKLRSIPAEQIRELAYDYLQNSGEWECKPQVSEFLDPRFGPDLKELFLQYSFIWIGGSFELNSEPANDCSPCPEGFFKIGHYIESDVLAEINGDKIVILGYCETLDEKTETYPSVFHALVAMTYVGEDIEALTALEATGQV